MRKSIFDIITECSINERMDSDLLQNDEYMKIQNKISEQSAQFDKLDLTQIKNWRRLGKSDMAGAWKMKNYNPCTCFKKFSFYSILCISYGVV